MSAARPTILIWVTHVLGIGHYRRALALARACAQAGLAPVIASGGMPVPGGVPDGVTLAQLPPIRSAGRSFVDLVGAGGEPADEALFAARGRELVALHDRHRPRAVVTELFPFGRRRFAGELDRLVAHARSQSHIPAILCSVRDILQPPSKPSRIPDIERRVRTAYDRILVHGDPALVRLEQSLPFAAGFADLIDYTGYIGGGETPAPPPGEGDGEVIVSAGGGAVGEHLLNAAIEARPLSAARDRPWRLLVGHNLPGRERERLSARAGNGVIVEPARPDFPGLLARARLSVSQAGYNTSTDILGARVPAVLVPFADDGEIEQTMRAELFEARGLAIALPPDRLAPQSLADAVDRALALDPGAAARPGLDGAAQSARLIADAIARIEA